MSNTSNTSDTGKSSNSSNSMPNEKYRKYEKLFRKNPHNNHYKRKMNKYKAIMDKNISLENASCNKHSHEHAKMNDLIEELQNIQNIQNKQNKQEKHQNQELTLDDIIDVNFTDNKVVQQSTKQTRGDIDTKIECLNIELTDIEIEHKFTQKSYNAAVEKLQQSYSIYNNSYDDDLISQTKESINIQKEEITKLGQKERNEEDKIIEITKKIEDTEMLLKPVKLEPSVFINNYNKVLDELKTKYNTSLSPKNNRVAFAKSSGQSDLKSE